MAFEMSMAVRMVFSCLVDADFRDTEAFFTRLKGQKPARDWLPLRQLLPQLRAAFDENISGYSADSELNRSRAEILSHVRAQAARAQGVYTLTVPTGGGKTLASMGFALDHATVHGARRIIYPPARKFSDYEVVVDGDELPEGVEILDQP